MRKKIITSLILSGFTASFAHSATLYTLDASTQSTAALSNTTIITSTALNVSGTDGDGIAAGAGVSGLENFDTNGVVTTGSNANAPYIRLNTTTFSESALDTSGTLQIDGFIEFTVSADPGFQLNLNTLSFDAARGGGSGIRGFELYGAADGATIDATNLLLDVNDADFSDTREMPQEASVDLSNPDFQGINSVTFRLYGLSDADFRSVDFQDFVLDGTVIPEPTSSALLFSSVGLLLFRRRKTS